MGCDGFGMVEKPRQAIERDIAIDLLKHVEHATDGLVVRGVQAERPALLHQMAHHRLQFVFHGVRQVGARLKEVLEVRCREHQHFSRTVVPQKVIALVQLHATGPVLEVSQFFLGFLRKQVVSDTDGQLLIFGQLFDDLIIVGIVLETPAGINCTGEAQAVEFAHELAGGVDLILQRQLRPLGEGRIENHRVGPRHQHAGRIAVGIAYDLATRRVRGITGITCHSQRGPIEQGPVIQVQNKDRGVRGRLVEFFQGGHAFFGELELVPAAHHAHPLRRWCALGLFLEHAQRIGQRGHTFPAQFEVVVQPATDQVQVRVIETRNDTATFEVNYLRVRTTQGHRLSIGADRHKAALANGNGAGLRVVAIDSMKSAIE